MFFHFTRSPADPFIPAHEKTPGERCSFLWGSSGGGRIRTDDLEVMSLASYQAAPPRVIVRCVRNRKKLVSCLRRVNYIGHRRLRKGTDRLYFPQVRRFSRYFPEKPAEVDSGSSGAEGDSRGRRLYGMIACGANLGSNPSIFRGNDRFLKIKESPQASYSHRVVGVARDMSTLFARRSFYRQYLRDQIAGLKRPISIRRNV